MDDQTSETVSDDKIPANTGSDDASLLLRIEEMVKTHISQIDNLSEEAKKYKDMLDDIFTNDEVYKQHDESAKEATRIKSNTKKEIMKRPQVADLAEKVKSLKSQKTELEDGLSDYLREYQRLSGSDQIEDDKGEIHKIVMVPKLVKTSTFKP